MVRYCNVNAHIQVSVPEGGTFASVVGGGPVGRLLPI